MVILSYHCPVLTIQREFVKLFPPGHSSITHWPLPEDLTNFPELGMCSKETCTTILIAFLGCQRFLVKELWDIRRMRSSSRIGGWLTHHLSCLCHPSRSIIFLSTTHWGTVNSDRNREPHHQLYITLISMSTNYQSDLQKRINTIYSTLPLSYKPLYYNRLASF